MQASWLSEQLQLHGYKAALLHDSMSGELYDATLREFWTASSRIIVTTDNCLCGIAMQQVPACNWCQCAGYGPKG